ncbi:hypothetical protein Lal_00029994 [Lupinus albus]|nr:hypothetical protein Lal_00029994 [Lupinus albus]
MGLVRAQSNKTGLKEGSDLGFPFFCFVVLGESKGRRREKREDEDGERIHGFSPPKTAAVFSFRRRANEELLVCSNSYSRLLLRFRAMTTALWLLLESLSVLGNEYKGPNWVSFLCHFSTVQAAGWKMKDKTLEQSTGYENIGTAVSRTKLGVHSSNESSLYKGKIFNSDEIAYNFYSLFAKSCGFSIRQGHTYKNTKNNIKDIYKREYICHRASIAKQQKVVEVKRQRRQKSTRYKCSAKLIITKRTIGFEERWVITHFSNSHNHTLLDNKEVHFLHVYRDIPINDQGRILLLSKAGCSVSIITRVLELDKGMKAGDLPFLEKDIRKFLQSHGNVGKDNEASKVLKLCKSLKDKDDVFQYDFTMYESNKLEDIIWVFGDSIRAYETFGDVVVFDTIYRINRYDTPLGLWVGVDNHGNSFFLVVLYCEMRRYNLSHEP